MNQNKFLYFFALVLVSVLFLSACSFKLKEDEGKSDANVATSQSPSEKDSNANFGEVASQSNTADFNQAVSNEGKGDTSVSSKPGATESVFSSGDFAENIDDGKSSEESTPSKDPVNPLVDENDQPIDPKPNTDLTYQEYITMTPTEQKAHYDSFDDVMDFISWLNAAKEKYNTENDSVKVEGGSIDLGEIMEKNS